MQSILDRLPLRNTNQTVHVSGRAVAINSFQIVVWVTFCGKGETEYDHHAPLVPAILDTGFNGYFCIREEQLRQWAGIDPRMFPLEHRVRTNRGPAAIRKANIWLHRNLAQTDEPSRHCPYRMELDEGMIVFTPPAPGTRDSRPRLPLLGMRALRRNKLLFFKDFKRGYVHLKKPRFFFAPFGI